MFAKMFDSADQNTWKEVETVILEDFGKNPEELFGISFRGEPGKGVMERTARASARLLLETDFINEANNAERMAAFVAGEPRLRGRVYIPKVFRELSSKRVMTAEWIEGVRLWDKETLQSPWRGGWRQGSPGCRGTSLDAPNRQEAAEITRSHPLEEHLKPNRNWWKGMDGKGGLGVSLEDTMQTVCHADPHPGNLLIRRLPSGKPEVVVLDHGLYVEMEPKFRHQYCLFWKSLMTFDNEAIGEIVSAWGIKNPDVFASATLMRPYTGGDGTTSAGIKRSMSAKEQQKRTYEMQQEMRRGIREILHDEKKWPRELIFIGRMLRIIQGNNQYLGAPVNRIKIMGNWASRSLVDSPDLSYGAKMVNLGRHLLFKLVMFGTDVLFYSSKIAQAFGRSANLEDDMEASMKKMAGDMGFELNHSVFEG
ncbi:MAG: hypothetical protein Q9169_003920 [Polycauliona sp. 2 TL-2023]